MEMQLLKNLSVDSAELKSEKGTDVFPDLCCGHGSCKLETLERCNNIKGKGLVSSKCKPALTFLGLATTTSGGR
jgi:hypothetical protein